MKWWLISDEDVQIVKKGLNAPTHGKNDYNCPYPDDADECEACAGSKLRQVAVYALDTGLNDTEAVPGDYSIEAAVKKHDIPHFDICQADKSLVKAAVKEAEGKIVAEMKRQMAIFRMNFREQFDRMPAREFIELPLEERRRILTEQANNPEIIQYYQDVWADKCAMEDKGMME